MKDVLQKVVLAALDPEDLGLAHGTRWPAEIAELARLRTRLTLGRSDLTGADSVRAVARAHLPVLEAFDPRLHAELLGIAAGAGVSPAEVVILNHYTDLRDIRRPEWGPILDPGGCSVAQVPTAAGGAICGQTWDMHGSARPFLRLIECRLAGEPTVTLLTLTGCLALAGMNEEGVAVLINNLSSNDARVGVVWGALVRRMLRERTAAAAMEVLSSAPIGSGHHYLISDGREAFSVETSGTKLRQLARGVVAPILHTNHCLLEEMRPTEEVPETSSTWVRMEHLRRRLPLLGARATPERLGAVFADHTGHPRSLCTHMSIEGNPDAPDTCGAVVFDHAERRLLAVAGCAVEGQWVETRVGEDSARPIDIPTL